MLAKDVNDNACYLDKRIAFTFFASKLAPTEPERRLQLLYQKQLFPYEQLMTAHFYPYS